MNVEDRIRAAYAERTAQVKPGAVSYAEVRRRVVRRRQVRRTRLAAAAAVTGVLVASAALAALPEQGDGLDSVTSPSPRRTPRVEQVPGTEASPAPTWSWPATLPSLPAGAVGYDDFVGVHEDDVVVASAFDGSVRRRVAAAPPGRRYTVSLSGDRRTVYVGAADTGCGRVTAVDVATGSTHDVAAGTQAQVSPDGRRLAVFRPCDSAVVVSRLGATTTRTIEGGNDGVVAVDWTADASRVVVTTETGVRLVDPEQDSRVDAVPPAWLGNFGAARRYGVGLLAIPGPGTTLPELGTDWVMGLAAPDAMQELLVEVDAGRVTAADGDDRGRLLVVADGVLYRWEPGHDAVRVGDWTGDVAW